MMGNYHARCGAGEKPEVVTPEAYLSLFGQIPDFDQKLATMRKYEISCSIILQALSQLKDIYKDKWNTIVANCDTKLFLGCDDSETIEWMLKMLGKKTTTVENTSWNSGNLSGSASYNKSSIELLTIDQITMMQDNECLVRIRGVRPYYGKKYNVEQHPNYKIAKEKEGKFIIPLSSDVAKADHRPLRLRRKSLPAADSEPKRLPELKESTKKAKNTAKKMEAAEAKKMLQNFDELANENTIVDDEAVNNMLMDVVGVTTKSTIAEIKEKVEELIKIERITGNFQFFETV